MAPLKQQNTADQTQPVTEEVVPPPMYRCPTCGQWVKSERYKVASHVFVWTTMTVLIWGMVLVSSRGQLLAWWAQRRDLVIIFACMPVASIYFWVQYLRERRKK